MTCRVLVYSRTDNLLAELSNFKLGTRSWVINGAGDCDLAIPRTDVNASEENFGRCNLVVIQSDQGIPDWGGVVQECDWSTPEWLRVRLRSKEILLRRKLVVWTWQMTSTPGAAAYQVFPNDVPGLYRGSFYTGGGLYDYHFPAWDIYDKVLPELVKTTDKDEPQPHEWFVDAQGFFHWTPGRGEDRSNEVILRSGYHILKWPDYKLKYDKLVTRALGLGNASNWDSKTKTWWEDPNLLYWGRYEAAIDVPSNTVMRTEKYARRLVQRNRLPQEIIDFRIGNPDGVWSKFWIGDTVRVLIPDYGWIERGGCDLRVRVMGIEVEEERKQMRISAKVIPENG